MLRQFQQVHGAAGCPMVYKRPDSPYPTRCRHASDPATLELDDQSQSRGEPTAAPPKPEPDDKSGVARRPEEKRFGLFRLLFQGQGRARGTKNCKDKSANRCSVCAMAMSRVNKVASWMHALKLARKSQVDGQATKEARYSTLLSEEWPCETAAPLAPVDLSLSGPEPFQYASL
ncbi:unnamed protein product [Ixodes hexagonus]